MPHPLARIIEQLKREPSRTGSIAITVFGDAIVPRGGSVWLGTLLEVSAEDHSGRRLLRESWPLERTADAYLKFMKTFEPLRARISRRARLSEGEAFTARILLIHYYRRVVLRDPLLPTSLLPKDWPGRAARQLCAEIYRGLLPASEQWLDAHGTNEKGALPTARELLERRFEAWARCYRNLL